MHKIDRPIEYARALFKLSEALTQDSFEDSHSEAVNLRDEAETILKDVQPDVVHCDAEDTYSSLVPIFCR